VGERKDMSNELPLRVHLIPITGESIETSQWACSKCHWVWKEFDLARACCVNEVKTFDYKNLTITELRNRATGKPRYVVTQEDLALSPEEINSIIKRSADLI